MNEHAIAVAGWIVTGLFGLIGWLIKMIFSKIERNSNRHDALEDKFDAFKLYAAETYTTKHDIRDMKKEILDHLVRIEDKLDQKADK